MSFAKMRMASVLLCLLAPLLHASPSPAPAEAKTLYKRQPSFYDSLPSTPKGGVFYDVLQTDIKTINPVLDADIYSFAVSNLCFMSLMTMDPETLEYLPALATSFEISADRKSYTFVLNSEAKWDDGTPVTSADVAFTLSLINNPNTNAAIQRSYYEGITVKVINNTTFTFKIPEPHFNSLVILAGFQPLQKKQFEKSKNFNEDPGILNPVGNGPYKFTKYLRSQYIELIRKKDWWGFKYRHFAQTNNFDSIILKIIPDLNLSYEKFIQGEVDRLGFTGEQWATKVTKFDKEKFEFSLNKTDKKLRALKLENSAPKSYSFIGFNLKRPIFKDIQVRKALAYLVDYDKINQKAFFNLFTQSTSPFGSFSLNSDLELRKPENKMHFDRAKAVELLKAAGWKLNKKNQLTKTINGKVTNFEFSLSVPSQAIASIKIAQILQEDLKKVGIKMNIKLQEWNTFLSNQDARRFDAVILGWSATLYSDPKQIFHSSSMANGGSNFVSYSNPKVDALITEANKEFNLEKRAKFLREINKILYEDQVYLFLFEKKYILEGLNTKIKTNYPIAKYENSTGVDRYYLSPP